MKPTLLKTLSVFGVACALTVALEAADGVLLVTKTTTGAESSTSQIQIERNRMRAEVHEPSVGNQTIIFDGTRQAMDIIDVSKKTYSEITQADVDKLASQMSDAMAQMTAAMASLPPAQRTQMETMMAGRGMPVAPVKTFHVAPKSSECSSRNVASPRMAIARPAVEKIRSCASPSK